jgi:hypothetical protein
MTTNAEFAEILELKAKIRDIRIKAEKSRWEADRIGARTRINILRKRIAEIKGN